MSDSAASRGLRLSWEINIATLIQIVQVVALLVALIYWFVVNAQRGADNERRLGELQTSMAQQTGELRQTLAVGLNEVRQQLSALPDQRARLDQAERRFVDIDARQSGNDTRITVLERQLLELRADVNAITRASNVPLPGRR